MFIWPSLGVVCAVQSGSVAYRCAMDARVEDAGLHMLTVSDIMVYFDHCKKVPLDYTFCSQCTDVVLVTLHV